MPTDPVAPLAPVPAPGSYLSLTYTVDETQLVEWEVMVPPRPIFRNGKAIDNDTPVTIQTPPGAGPFFDVNFPSYTPGTVGNPTGSSNIQFNGFKLGDNGTILDETPPRGEIAPPPPPQAPPWNGQDTEQEYMTSCEAYLNDLGVDPTTATQMCAAAWTASQTNPAHASAQQSSQQQKPRRRGLLSRSKK